MWFSKETFLDKHLRGYGCGVVALHDLSAYKKCIKSPKSREEFKEHIRKMEKAGMFVFPYLGIAPYYYPFLCDLYLIRHKIPIRLGWGHTAMAEYWNGAKHIRKCLENDMPVIFAVGPTHPFFFKKKNLKLYTRDRKPSGNFTKAHYMTVLGMTKVDGEIWLEIVSWGRQYSVRLKELANFSKYTVPFTTRFYTSYMKGRVKPVDHSECHGSM